jgi:carbon monoxide dehydrogenase subunit G
MLDSPNHHQWILSVPKISESFDVAQPVDRVWALLQDIPEVMTCLPGAEFTGQSAEDVYGGKVTVKLGAVTASFDGDATVIERDEATHACSFNGKGIDKRGGSRAQATFSYRLTDTDGNTHVAVDADIKLTGKLAQMGRTGIFNDVAHQITGEFAANLEQKLLANAADDAGAPPSDIAEPVASEISALKMLGVIVRGRWRALCAVLGIVSAKR